MIPSILILILHVHVYHINSVFINYTERCPGDNLERILRATALCSTIEEYHCLYDEDFHLAEICQNYKPIPKGRFPRYSSYGDAIYYDPCPETRYQHGPAKSFQITDCLFEKSKCVSEGQKLCTTGTASTDSTCECDYKNGYAMIGGKCCSPTSYEDCTCFRKDCPDENQELDPDYNCVNKCASGFDRKEGDFYCTVKLHTSIDIETTSPTTPAFEDGDFILEKPHDGTAKIILYVGLGVYCLHILFILIYGYTEGIWRPFRYKLIPYSVWCGITIPCLILGWHFISERKTVAIILSVLLVVLICLSCLLIYVLWTHQIQKEHKVYNEEYDVRIFGLLMAASKGDMNKLKQLKDEKYIDMEDTDYDKRSALHLAAVTGNVEAVDFLLKNHFCFPGPHDRWGRSVSDDIMWHLENRDIKDLKEKWEGIIEKIFVYMFQERRFFQIKKKKEHFLEIKAIQLIKAAEKGDLDTVKRLKNLGTDMNLSNSMGRTALHAAAENSMKDIVEYLLDDCEVSSFVRMKWMNLGTDMNLSNFMGQTALHAAAENSMKDIVKYLLDDCEVSSFVRMRDHRPIDVVPSDGKEVNNKIKEMLQTDMNESLKKEVKKMEPLDDDLKIVRLLTAASRGDIKQMKSYYEADYDMTVANYDNRTALHIAVSDNQEHIIRFLLEVCELHEIAKYGKDRWDTTPLSASRERGKKSVYDVFLELCPELVDTETDQYRTYLLLNAGADNDVQTLRRLCEKKVDMDLRDYNGRTALHLAAAENNLEAVKYLVETAKVKKSIPDRENRKPVDEAVTYRETKEDLTDNEEKDNKKIIDILEKTKEKETQSTLVDDNFEKHKNDEKAKISLFLNKAYNGDIKAVGRYLKPYPELLNKHDYDKRTALHLAAAEGHIDLVKFIVKQEDVDKGKKDRWGTTPLDEAKKKGNKEIIDILQS